jgi:hypothetical protein
MKQPGKVRGTADIIASMRVSLGEAHVQGVPEYIKKLLANSNNRYTFKDIFLEGKAALMFAGTGCEVTMRESPDLFLKFNDERFYAEVKHFRLKNQDQCSDTVPPAWEQVYNVAKKKIAQYREQACNILVIENNDDRMEELDIPTTIDAINKDVRSGKCQEFAKLNGILLIALDWYNISQGRRVFFYYTSNPAVSLRRELFFLLDGIRS